MPVSKFFNKTFFKETIRSLKILGIVCTVISLLIGMGSVSEGTLYVCMYIVSSMFFVIAGVHIASRIKRRSVCELYGSIPVSRRQMWGSYTLAAVILGAAIIIVNIAAVGIHMGIQTLRGTSFIPIFDWGRYMANMAAAFIVGICAMNLVMIGINLTGNGFGAVVAIYLIVLVAVLSLAAMSRISRSPFGIFSMLFPVMPATKIAILWAMLIVLMLVLTFFSCKTFVSFRMESSGKFMRSRKTAIIFAIIAATCAGLSIILNGKFDSVFISAASGIGAEALIVCLIEGIVVYLGIMLIQHRKSKVTLKELVYFPISIGAVGIVIAVGLLFRENAKTIDIKPDNIAYITIPQNLAETIDSYSYVNTDSGIYNDTTVARNGYGTDGEEKIHIVSPKVINLICEGIRETESEMTTDSVFGFKNQLMSSILGYMGYGIYSDFTVTLKDGRDYTVSISVYDKLTESILECDEYIDKALDVSRFEGGRILAKEERFQKLLPVFIEEYNKLSRDDKLKVYGYELKWENLNVYGNCFLVSRDGSQNQLIAITSLTPETAKMYIDICNEFTGEAKYMDFAMQRLYTDEFGYADCLFGVDGFCKSNPRLSYSSVYESMNIVFNSTFSEEVEGEIFYDDQGNEVSRDEYIRLERKKQKIKAEAKKELAELLEAVYSSNASPWDSDYVISINDFGWIDLEEEYTDEDGRTMSWSDYYESIPYQIANQLKKFIGVTEEQYMRLFELMDIYTAYLVDSDFIEYID